MKLTWTERVDKSYYHNTRGKILLTAWLCEGSSQPCWMKQGGVAKALPAELFRPPQSCKVYCWLTIGNSSQWLVEYAGYDFHAICPNPRQNSWLIGWMNKNTARPRRWNVTTSIIGLKNGQICKHLIKDGEPQRYSWRTQKKKKETLHFIFERK